MKDRPKKVQAKPFSTCRIWVLWEDISPWVGKRSRVQEAVTLRSCRGQCEEGGKPEKGRATVLNVRPPGFRFWNHCAISQCLPEGTYQHQSHPDNSDTDSFAGRTLRIWGRGEGGVLMHSRGYVSMNLTAVAEIKAKMVTDMTSDAEMTKT